MKTVLILIALSLSLFAETSESLIRRLESYRSVRYTDLNGSPVVGYGTTKGRLVARTSVTHAEALRQLRADIRRCEETVDEAVLVPLTPNQRAALTSFVYNVGRSAFLGSTLLTKLNRGFYREVPAEMRRWIKCNGRPCDGLRNRREEEILLWNAK